MNDKDIALVADYLFEHMAPRETIDAWNRLVERLQPSQIDEPPVPEAPGATLE